MFFRQPRRLYNTTDYAYVLVRAKQLAVGDTLSTGETVTNIKLFANLDFVHVQLDKSDDLIEYAENILIRIRR